MDTKAVFIRTSKGEDEISGKTAHLYSAIKRVLLMVDGVSTLGEISKRAAPSMRDSLDEMLEELKRGGFVQDQAKSVGISKMPKAPKMSMPSKLAVPPKQAIPPKLATPPKPITSLSTDVPLHIPVSSKQVFTDDKPADPTGGILDFTDDFFSSMPAKLAADAAKTDKPEGNDAAQSQQVIDTAKLKAQNEAAAILMKAEQKAAAIRAAAEQEAAQLRAKLQEEAKLKAGQAAQVSAQARAQAEKSVVQPLPVQPSNPATSASHVPAAPVTQPTAEIKPSPKIKPVTEIKPETEIKLDPFFIFDPFQIQTPSQPASQQTNISAIELEPEIKLDAFIFDAPSAPKAAVAPHSFAAQAPVDAAKTLPVAEAGQAARPIPKPPEISANQQAIKQAEALRITKEAQARQSSDDQSRAAAELRAAAAAKASPELTFQKVVLPDVQPAARRAPVARARRKRFPWSKFAIFVLVLLVSALFVLPYVLPTRDYVPKIEQMLAEKLHQPVQIGQLSGRILPTPRLEIGELQIGDAKQLQAQQAHINFPLLGLLVGLLGKTIPVDNIELRSVKVTGTGLLAASSWLQQLAADPQYPVRRMVISQGTLDADAIQFTDMDGELIFDRVGKFSQANLRAYGGKIALGITAVPDSKLQVAITMYTIALPLLPEWKFDELSVTGELGSGDLSIKQFEGRMLGGTVQGDAHIDWRSGWRAQGTLVAKAVSMQSLSQGLSGDMDGSARFVMQAASLSGLADTAALDGAFVVRNGTVNGIDIVETARSRSKESVPGGRTHFEQLSGVLSATKDGYALRQLKMNAGALNVSGTLDIIDQQLSGRISTDLSKWAGMGKVTMQVGGTTDNPSLRAAR